MHRLIVVFVSLIRLNHAYRTPITRLYVRAVTNSSTSGASSSTTLQPSSITTSFASSETICTNGTDPLNTTTLRLSSPTIETPRALITGLATLPTSSIGNSTCPKSYPSNYPIGYTQKPYCESLLSWVNDDCFQFCDYADSCLGGWCETRKYAPATAGYLTTSTRTWFSGVHNSLGDVTSQSFWTETYTWSVWPEDIHSVEAPCCHSCSIAVGTIELFYWPTATPLTAPVVSGIPSGAVLSVSSLGNDEGGILVDENGFTFTSPSIYLGFTTIWARNRCSTIGPPISFTTIAFDLSEISTIPARTTFTTCTFENPWVDDEPDEPFKYYPGAEYPPPLPLTVADIAQDCSSIKGYFWDPANPYLALQVGDPCHPLIHVPDRLFELRPDWKDCKAYLGGFYDPPKTLRLGGPLVPTTEIKPTVPPQTPATATSHDPVGLPPTPSAKPTPPPAVTPIDPPVDPPADPPADPPIDPPLAHSNSVPAAPSRGEGTTNIAPPTAPPAQTAEDGNLPSITVVIIRTQSSFDPGQGQPTKIDDPPPLLPIDPATAPGGTFSITGSLNPVSARPVDPVDPIDASLVTFGDKTLTTNGNTAFVIGTQTLKLNDDPVTVDGTTLMMTTNSAGSILVLAGTRSEDTAQPTALPLITLGDPTGTAAPVLTLGQDTVTANDQSAFVVGMQTLRLGGPPITLDGTTFLMTTNSAGATVVLAQTGSQTPFTSPLAPYVVSLGATVLTVNAQSEFIIGTQTLKIGGSAITVNKTTYWMTWNGDGQTVVIASSSVALGTTTGREVRVTLTKGGPRSTSSGRARETASATGGLENFESGTADMRDHWSLRLACLLLVIVALVN